MLSCPQPGIRQSYLEPGALIKIDGSGVNLLYCMDVNAKFDFVDQQANNNIVHLL